MVGAPLCISAPRGANHICGPSDLLSTTTCFRKPIAYIAWCSSCGQNLIQFATLCLPTASCATCTFAEPQNSLPKNGHEHYHDVPKHCIQISSDITEFLDCFIRGLPALDTFLRFTCPQIIPHELALGETCTFVHAVHRPYLLQFL
jgi:hypothetical protein